MNWGTKIFLAFTFFACFIIFMVVRAFQEDFDLVAEDYYAQELNYQARIQQKANLQASDQRATVSQEDTSIMISFQGISSPKGEIHFYHPSRKIFDRKYAIDSNAKVQVIDRKELVAGRYRVNITWESEGKAYFQQEELFVR